MKLNYLRIINFKSIRDMEIKNIEDALILVGKNNTGKTVVMDAVRLVSQPEARIDTAWFNEPGRHIKMEFVLGLSEDDLTMFYELGLVSRYKNKKAWEREFLATLFLIFFIFSNFYTIPCAVIASTTFSNPAILAPTT